MSEHIRLTCIENGPRNFLCVMQQTV